MKDTRYSISITSGTIVTALVIGLIAYALWTLRDLVLLVVTAIVMASAIRPGVLFFMRYKLPRALAVFGMYTAVFGALFGFIYFFLPPLLGEVGNFINALPHYLQSFSLPAPFGSSGASSFLSTNASGTGTSFVQSLFSLQKAFTNTSAGAFSLLATVFGGLFSLIFVIVLSFYFAVQEEGIEGFLRTITPLSQEEYVIDLWRRSQKKIGLWMQGQIMLSVLVGVLVYLGLLIIGIPYALLIGIFTAMMEIIPIFGSFIAAVPAIAIAFTTGGATLSVIVAGLYIVVNQFEAHLIYPLVVKKIVGVPPLLVIVAMVAGGELAGFLGLLLSIPLAAILQEFVGDLDKGRRARFARK
ncbi:MAG TPA: AI-2E family transporter [Candidatus Kaiserbacteria bacterium]|nr:AI-2E family transporter [Candidatus Kaiserbacteria bacterium]